MLEIQDNEIVFSDYDLDHCITGYSEDKKMNFKEFYKNALSRFEFEISISNNEIEFDDILKLNCVIPLNNSVMEIKENYNNFLELCTDLYKYKDNKDVFPYYEKEL